MAADPESVSKVVEGAVTLLAVFGLVPAAILAPVVLIGRGVAELVGGKKVKQAEEEIERFDA